MIGRAAEDLVAARLADACWEIVERNARTRFGELDIVALDGPDSRLRRGQGRACRAPRFGPERPILAIGPRSSAGSAASPPPGWRSAAQAVPRYAEIRFDAVGVTFDRAGRARPTSSASEGAFCTATSGGPDSLTAL